MKVVEMAEEVMEDEVVEEVEEVEEVVEHGKDRWEVE